MMIVVGMRGAHRWLGLLAMVAACREPAPPDPGEDGGDDEGLPELEPGEVQLGLPLSGPTTATGRLVGWNIGRGTLYAPPGDPLHPEWRTTGREEAFATLATLRGPADSPPLVRFSGLQIDGALGGDGYHFWDFADPQHTPSASDNMAPFEYMAIVDEIGAQPLVTLNFGSGTATEAADYVRHLVGTTAGDPIVDARAFWGRDTPWRPVAYELGNEIYGDWNTGFLGEGAFSYANPTAIGGGDPPWHGRPAEDPADYAARALEYVEAVLDVDPQARFWVPLSQAPMDGWEGLDVALPALEPLLVHPAVQAVVVHHYQVDDAATLGVGPLDDPLLAFAGAELFRAGYQQLRARLDALRPELQIAVTEYHVGGAFTLGGFDAVADTHRVGLGVAEQMILQAQLGVDYGEQHMAVAFGDDAEGELLFEPWYNPFVERGGILRPRPSFLATLVVAEHLLAQTVAVEPIEVPLARFEGQGSFEYPVVHAVGFVDGDEASVLVLHRELVSARTLSIDLPPDEGWRLAGATAYAPPDVIVPIGEQDIGLAAPVVEEGRDRLRLTLPPHSLVGLRLQR